MARPSLLLVGAFLLASCGGPEPPTAAPTPEIRITEEHPIDSPGRAAVLEGWPSSDKRLDKPLDKVPDTSAGESSASPLQ
jgi:hypothetical protein